MPYFAVASTRDIDAAVRRAGNAALGLWTRAGAWSVARLTDGLVPREVAEDLGTAPQIRRLVSAGLWEETPDGYAFTTWESDGNRTRNEVENLSESRRNAGHLGGKASGKSRRSEAKRDEKTPDSFPRTPADQRKPEPSASSKTNPLPYPPLPSPPLVEGARVRARETADAATAVVQAWVNASPSRPGRSEIGDAQRIAAELVEAGNPVEALTEAAQRTGEDGYGPRGFSVALRQIRTAGRPRRGGQMDKIAALQALKHQPAGEGPGRRPDAVPGEVVELRPAAGDR